MDDVWETGGLSDVTADRSRRIYESQAYCTYATCVEKYKRLHNQKLTKYAKQFGVPIDVKKTAIDCPDCGNALIWRPTKYKTYVFDYAWSD